MDRESVSLLSKWLSSRIQLNDDIDHYHVNLIVHPSDEARALAPGLADLHLKRYKASSPVGSSTSLDYKSLFKWINKFLTLLNERRPQLVALESLRLACMSRPVEQTCNGSATTCISSWLLQNQLHNQTGKGEDRKPDISMMNQFNQKDINARANQYVDEAISCLKSAIALECAPDLYVGGADLFSIDEPNCSFAEIMSQVLVYILASSAFKMVVRSSNYHVCLAAAYLHDLIYEAGAPRNQIQLLAMESRRGPSISSSFRHPLQTIDEIEDDEELSNLSCQFESSAHLNATKRGASSKIRPNLVICMQNDQPSLASRVVRDTYVRIARSSSKTCCLIVLVEESQHERFVADWLAGLCESEMTLDYRAVAQPKIEFNCINVRAARERLSSQDSNTISVVRFRSLEELARLTRQLRSVAHTVHLCTDNHGLARDLAFERSSPLRASVTHFLLNPVGVCDTYRNTGDQLMLYYRRSMKSHMNDVYSFVRHQFERELEALRKQQATWYHGQNNEQRCTRVLRAYLDVLSKCRSMRGPPGTKLGEPVRRLKRFQLGLRTINEAQHRSTETSLKPVGIAVLVLDFSGELSFTKSKPIVAEFVFKNLSLGNAVLLVCAQQILGIRFPMQIMRDSNLPFIHVDQHRIANARSASQQNGYVCSPEYSPFNSPASAPAQLELSSCGSTQSSCDTTNLNDTGFVEGATANGAHLDATLPRRMAPPRHRCPKHLYAVEFLSHADFTTDKVDALVLALGARRRSLCYPDIMTNLSGPAPINVQPEQPTEMDGSSALETSDYQQDITIVGSTQRSSYIG